MRSMALVVFIFSVFLVGCSSVEPHSSESRVAVGSDKNKYGCIGSAGYQWCAASEECERPWELAEKEGFVNTPENFKEYCSDSSSSQ